MKRSIALKFLATHLKLTGNHYCDNGRDFDDAEKLLKAMEHLGMLPPPDEFTIHAVDNTGKFAADVFYDNPSDTSRLNLWSKEDE